MRESHARHATFFKMRKRTTARPISRIKRTNPYTGKESNPLTDWHADIYGPIATASLFGNHRYVLSFIDRNTKTIINAFLQRITSPSICDGIRIFSQQLQQMISNLTPTNIDITLGKTIKTDSATYFKTQEVHDTLRQHGFSKHLYSPPHTQAHNGIIERSFQTIPPSARAMLHAANINEHLWPEAYAHATYIYDIMPHSGNPDNKSPYEIRTGHKPCPKNLYPFGARCWSWTPQRNKDDPKSTPGIYLGHHPFRRLLRRRNRILPTEQSPSPHHTRTITTRRLHPSHNSTIYSEIQRQRHRIQRQTTPRLLQQTPSKRSTLPLQIVALT
eukprot:m.306766 g.306766  ORF g.306766 m.306766 type:complete len:330 (-) comp20191_c1_seq57:1784-2773(-)